MGVERSSYRSALGGARAGYAFGSASNRSTSASHARTCYACCAPVAGP